MRAFVDKMHQRGQQWMPLVNAGVAAAKGFRAYDEGSKDGIWIKDNEGADYHGQVRVCSAAWRKHHPLTPT
jgi:alpha-glucosidase (family GH31 glycosyl hydrolase)